MRIRALLQVVIKGLCFNVTYKTVNEAGLGSRGRLVQRSDFIGIATFLDLAGNLGTKMATFCFLFFLP